MHDRSDRFGFAVERSAHRDFPDLLALNAETHFSYIIELVFDTGGFADA